MNFALRFGVKRKQVRSFGSSKYDAVVIGAGHNGLTAANYLAKGSQKVLVLEKRHLVGGAAVTEELTPGYKFSRASYLAGLLRPCVVEELELKKYGLKFYHRDPNSFTPLQNGSYLLLDMVKNEAEIAKFSTKDAKAYKEYCSVVGNVCAFVDQFIDKEPLDLQAIGAQTPLHTLKALLSLARIREAMELLTSLVKLGKDFPTFVELMTFPAAKFLDRWFESDVLKATLATDSVVGSNLSPFSYSSGYVLLHHVMGSIEGKAGSWAYVEGGMGSVSNALAKAAQQKGVDIMLNAAVQKINVGADGAVKGVVLLDGRTFESNIVVSNLTPHLTFSSLCDPSLFTEEFNAKRKTTDYTSPVTKINVALKGLPNFKCYPNRAEGQVGPQHIGTIHINCASMADIHQAFLSGQSKWSSVPIIEMTIPSSMDPTLAPPGHHVASLFVQYTPNMDVFEDEQKKTEFCELVFDTIEQYAPGFRDLVIYKDVITPRDFEEIFGLTGGNICHGSIGLDQLWSLRPWAGQANYATPIKGLYLCGAGTHPGGGVMGACGRNAAKKVLAHDTK